MAEMIRTDHQVRVQPQFSSDQLEVIKAVIAPGCTEPELQLFIEYCRRTGLDPFARQIYAIKRRVKEKVEKVNANGVKYTEEVWTEKLSIQTSIDGFRVTAQRTNSYRGVVSTEWCGPDGKWVDVWLAKEPPAAARVSVMREGFGQPQSAVALWSEYNQDVPMWRKMPAGQLAKCAEALALRKAFPNDLSGLYTDDEIHDEQPADRVRADLEAVQHGQPTRGQILEHGEVVAAAPAEARRVEELEDAASSEPASPATPSSEPRASSVDGDLESAGDLPGAAEGPSQEDEAQREELAVAVEAMSKTQQRAFFEQFNMSAQSGPTIRHRLSAALVARLHAGLPTQAQA